MFTPTAGLQKLTLQVLEEKAVEQLLNTGILGV